MKKILVVLTVALVAITINGCGDGKPRLDTSSDENMKESVSKIMAELSTEKQERFEYAITGIYMFGGMGHIGKDETESEVIERVNEKLDGKTAKEVFEIAKELKSEMSDK